jgi:trehalose utilization protein
MTELGDSCLFQEMPRKLRVTVWGENVHERTNPIVRKIYPHGMHATIADAIATKNGKARPNRAAEFVVGTATLQQPQHGLTKRLLDETDVLVWWGHAAHGRVSDRVVERVLARVWEGMGFIALHSSHYSKPFMRLMGTSCSITWREAGEKERLWVCNPAHPIARGINRYFEIPNTEMYGEPFAVPAPDEIVFISWFEGGEVFRSGCTWKRGNGKIFYFRPANETYPIYHDKNVRLVLRNAVRWAAPDGVKWIDSCPQISAKDAPEPLEIKGPRLHKEGEAGFR